MCYWDIPLQSRNVATILWTHALFVKVVLSALNPHSASLSEVEFRGTSLLYAQPAQHPCGGW